MAASAIQTNGGRRPGSDWPPADWQAVLAEAVSDPAELCRLLGLDGTLASAARRAAGGFPLLAPRPFLARIAPGNPHDPLLVQVLPQEEELRRLPDFQGDPLGEAAAARGPGLLWKYRGRLLIVTTGACAVHCRFCFRRHFRCPLPAGGGTDWVPALRLLAAEPSIEEVVLSGGDPLTLPDAQLAYFSRQLANVPHLRRLRIHSRLPIMVPQRVTGELLDWLRGTRLTTIMVVQVNHAAEIDAAVAAALGRLVEAGVPLLAQTVLLRGVNDDARTLAELYGRLVDLRIMPYYLHQLDRVAGAAHFEVPVARGIELIGQLRRRLPGYAVPRDVRETPGEESKTVLA
jgi:EF-P beta-lysylation protein EpmB